MSKYDIDNIRTAIIERRHPTITLYNRLESRPRKRNFDRALKAEVRDPLWMLCKQWQMGEFIGDDAGSPVKAKVHLQSRYINKYQSRQFPVEHFKQDIPLEAQVEQRDVPFVRGQQAISIDLRLSMGRQWQKLLGTNPALAGYRAAFLEKYKFELPAEDSLEGAPILAHPEAWQHYAAIAGRRMDGGALYLHLQVAATNTPHDDIVGIDAGDHVALEELGQQFVQWFQRLFYQGAASERDAWVPERMEYQCALGSETNGQSEKSIVADEYYQGRLDWYNFDWVANDQGLGTPEEGEVQDKEAWADVQEFIPTPIDFDGMPNTRWWAFEEGKTNFGDIKPGTTDIGKLLFMEFGLVYANDWFLIPYTLPVGSMTDVSGISVTNVFGERIWVSAAGGGFDNDWSRWSMFNLSIKNDMRAQADTSLVLLPTVPKIQNAEDKESILFIRDEMANMVWGIEQKVQLPTGQFKPGSEAATEKQQYFERLLGKVDPNIPFAAPIRYQVMNSVPEHWIPFIPVHRPGNNRQVQLQRAAMPRIIEGNTETPVKVRPRTRLLREGLDQDMPEAYFLHEEEVPRAGVQVVEAYQRTRWYGGKVVNWLGVRKVNGRGEGSSGLAFDQLVANRRTKLREK